MVNQPDGGAIVNISRREARHRRRRALLPRCCQAGVDSATTRAVSGRKVRINSIGGRCHRDRTVASALRRPGGCRRRRGDNRWTPGAAVRHRQRRRVPCSLLSSFITGSTLTIPRRRRAPRLPIRRQRRQPGVKRWGRGLAGPSDAFAWRLPRDQKAILWRSGGVSGTLS